MTESTQKLPAVLAPEASSAVHQRETTRDTGSSFALVLLAPVSFALTLLTIIFMTPG